MNHLEKIQNKILNKDNLAEWVAECRAKGSKIDRKSVV